MVVNSINFWFFFVAVIIPYYVLLRKTWGGQNMWLLLASYFFYGWIDWKMLPLLLIVTLVFYAIGLSISKFNHKNPKLASRLTTLGVCLGVGVLVYFKYLGFFIQEFAHFLDAIGLHSNPKTFDIIMPIGISFFTFKLISYVIEVHREHIEPSRDIVEFATYIAFFPTILSGPIDRPNKFIPQLRSARIFDKERILRGGQQVLWGIFKKMVIADNLTAIIENTWQMDSLTGSTYLLATLLYTVQMYADFSGYSDMAIGVGNILGFDIAVNFKYPFFSRNVSEYWRGWHMSLTSWLTDYIFLPLNLKFMEYQKVGLIIAIIINMFLVGIWHGANWTFAVFGLYHGLLFVPLIITGAYNNKKKMITGRFDLPKARDFLKMIFTFVLVTIGLLIFRADSISDALKCFSLIISPSLFSVPRFVGWDNATFIMLIPFIITLFVADWRNRNIACPLFFKNNHGIKAVISYTIIVSAIYFLGAESSSFIYFKF